MDQLHASGVEIDGAGLLIRGAPGSGKSDLALRLIDGGAKLIADDRVDLNLAGGKILLSAPGPIEGLLEIRGLGILRLPTAQNVPLALLVDLVDEAEVERLPEIHTKRLINMDIPWIGLAPFQSSAPAKLRHALALVNGRLERTE